MKVDVHLTTMSNENAEPNPWKHLSTITTFDNGNTWTTRRLDETHDAAAGGQIIGRVAPSTSRLIESLVREICNMFEQDQNRQDKLYLIVCDKLHEMKLIDSSYNMLELEPLRGQYQHAWYKLFTIARAAAGCESIIEIPNPRNLPIWSRYKLEFDELEFIAAGGFGSVYRALHRLDGHHYAVKKIIVRSGRVKNLIQQLEEVKTLAKLNHPNIVAYKGAWIEQNLPQTFLNQCIAENFNSSGRVRRRKTAISASCVESVSRCDSHNQSQLTGSSSNRVQNESDTFSGMYQQNNGKQRINREKCNNSRHLHLERRYRTVKKHFQKLNSATDIVGRRIAERFTEISTERQNSDIVSFRNDDDNDDVSVSSVDSNEIEEIHSNVQRTSAEDQACNWRVCQYDASALQSKYATLYIQMALCEKTLRAWLDERHEATPEPMATVILTQILSGLHYIHSRGTVHHDIKPSNIFICASGQHVEVQVGDFGLACPLQRENHPPMLGTELYAAPEQLNGSCDPKSDLYSLGIVLFEILFPMKTYMERNSLITQLKLGRIPENFTKQYPKWADLIKKLLHYDSKRRPSTVDLLRDLSEDKDVIIAKLTDSNRQQETTINDLRRENEELKDQVNQLQDEIKRLRTPQ